MQNIKGNKENKESKERKKSKSKDNSSKKGRSRSRSKSRSRSRSRSLSRGKAQKVNDSKNQRNYQNESEIPNVKEESKKISDNAKFNYLSKTSQKNTFDLMQIDNLFEESIPDLENNSENLFERKKNSKKYLEIQKDINLNKPNLDNTLHEFQKKFLSLIIQKVNEDNKNIEQLKDFIKKCGVVLTQKEFQEELNKIKNAELFNDIKYKDFKVNIINSLEYLLTYDNIKDIDLCASFSREKLELDKDYTFNNFINISEENCYYYTLCSRLYNNIYKILSKFHLYEWILINFKEFLKSNNLNNLTKEKQIYFEVLNYYLTDDKASIDNTYDLNDLQCFLSQDIISMQDIRQKIVEINSQSDKRNYRSINLSINNNYLEFKFTNCIRISKQNKFEEKYISKFELDCFNELFKKISIENLYKNLDDELYNCIIYSKLDNNNCFDELKPFLKKALLNITNSEAMKKFFRETYEKNYNLTFAFDKEDIINEFFNKISFIKLIGETNAFADPIDLKMYLPYNPGKIKDLNYLGEIKILRFGRFLIIIIHELIGHLLRRYYYYLTNGKVPQNTASDKKMKFGKEGGRFIERNLLGKEFLYISMEDIFHLLSQQKKYPIIDYKNELTKENIKKVILEYKELFNFISLEKDDDKGKIPLENYYIYLTKVPNSIIKPNKYSFTSYIEI